MALPPVSQASRSSVFLSRSRPSVPGRVRDRCPISCSTATERLEARMGCKVCMLSWVNDLCEQAYSNSSNNCSSIRARRLPYLHRARRSRRTVSKRCLRRLVGTRAMGALAATFRPSRLIKGKAIIISGTSRSDIIWMEVH